LGIRQSDAIKDEADLVSGVESPREYDATPQPELEIVGIVALVLLAAKGTGGIREFIAQRAVPIDALQEFVDLVA